VVKVGTSLLTLPQNGLDLARIGQIVSQLVRLKKRDMEVILVTSGAIGAGRGRLGLAKPLRTIPQKQAMAAIGQNHLMSCYENFFSREGCVVAQVLLTKDDMNNRQRYLNASNTLLALLEYKAIPIINENDTVAVDEIKFGDNDTLSALIASKIEADLLIILSDIEGLYTTDPREDKDAKLIKEVRRVTPQMERLSGGPLRGTGGMYTKLKAAKIAMASGTTMVIADGRVKDIIISIVEGKDIGTRFLPQPGRMSSRKRWIAFGMTPKGRIVVDKGAQGALINKKSLLPAGIISVEGEFKLGDSVSIVSAQGDEFARGLVYYSTSEIELVRGQKTERIVQILGYKDYDEVVHRDNLVIL